MTAPATAAEPMAQELCLSCGLCCDGSLFWAVELEVADAVPDWARSSETGPIEAGPTEAGPIKTGPIETGPIEAGPAGAEPARHLPQPCAFHCDGACEIYATRPGQCRAFVCNVLQAVHDGARDRAWGQARIEAMRHLLAGLDDALPGEGALYRRAASYLEDARTLPDDARIRARIAVYREMIGDFRPLSDPAAPSG